MWPRAAASFGLGLASLAFLNGCDDTAIVFEIASTRPAPAELDGVCMSVAAVDAVGDDGVFARRYQFDSLPQTLTVLPGDHGDVIAWARGTRGGVETARDGGRFSFQDGAIGRVRLDLPTCPGGAFAPRLAGQDASIPDGARVAIAFGWRQPVIVALWPGSGVRLRASANGLATLDAGLPDAPASGIDVLLAFDADGDCDDDLLVGAPDAGPVLWLQDGSGVFTLGDGGLGGLPAIAAAAAGDVDGDADLDLLVGGGASVRLLLNDGAGRFAEASAAIPAGVASDVTALALGDFSADGHPDLVIGQGSGAAAPRRVLVNDQSGSGSFMLAPALLPEIAEQTRALALVDADGDGNLDLFTAALAAPVRLYVNRGDGRLEDQSFVRLPLVMPTDAVALAAADLDGDCQLDVAIARADGSVSLWLGSDTGVFAPGNALQSAGAALALDDADGDGVRDLITIGAQGLTWVAPR